MLADGLLLLLRDEHGVAHRRVRRGFDQLTLPAAAICAARRAC
jgi:hypothetical protein